MGAEIDLYFQAEGKLFGEVNGFLDTLTGDNSFNKNSLAETGEKVAKLGGSLKFILEGAVKVAKSYDLLLFSVSLNGEASLRAEAEFKLAFSLKANDSGFYLQPVYTFEGLEIIATAKVDIDIDADKNKDSDNDGFEGGVSYQVLDRVIKNLDPIELYN